MSTPFDRALDDHDLLAAAHEYAARHGTPGTAAYRAAWLRFRTDVRTREDLETWRRRQAARRRDWDAVLRLAIERAMLIDGATMADAQIVDPRNGGLRMAPHTGFPTEFLAFFERVDHTMSTACATAHASERPIWVTDTIRSPLFAGSRALDVMLDAGSRAVASLPVAAPNGDVIAVISTHHRRPATWTRLEQRALRLLAQSAGRILSELHPPTDRESELHT